MENSIQVVVGIIISIFIFFVFPVYMAYEKLDDISYVLAMRYTQDFVDNVRNKGYITKSMYEDYKSKLKATGNSYDIELTHKKTRVDPMSQKYNYAGGKYTLEDTGVYGSLTGANVVDTYLFEEEVYTTRDIEAVLNSENKLWLKATTDTFTCIDSGTEDLNTYHPKVKDCEYAYTMNENDNFNVTIRNTNTTVATAIYNMITVNTVDNNTRIYVNYGGTIISEKWYGKIDYKKMKHDDMSLEKKQQVLLFDDTEKYPFKIITSSHIESIQDKKEYILEFEAKPFEITDLREKGYKLKRVEIEGDGLYNIVAGTGEKIAAVLAGEDVDGDGYDYDYLHISIGLNGVSILVTNPYNNDTTVVLSYPVTISGFKKFKIEVVKSATSGKYLVKLYIDNIKVDENTTLSRLPLTIVIGATNLTANDGVGYYPNRLDFNGSVRNAFIYY